MFLTLNQNQNHIDENGDYVAELRELTTARNPRELDNFGTLLLSRGGDNLPYSLDGLLEIMEETGYNISTADRAQFIETMGRYIEELFNATRAFPVFRYDHGAGLSLDSNKPGAHFAGFIFDTYGARKDFGFQDLEPEIIEQKLRHEVEIYDNYLQGEVYEVDLIDYYTGEIKTLAGALYGYTAARQVAALLADSYGAKLVDVI